jgi:hypothetical protein
LNITRNSTTTPTTHSAARQNADVEGDSTGGFEEIEEVDVFAEDVDVCHFLFPILSPGF